jgi:hypothetical protein
VLSGSDQAPVTRWSVNPLSAKATNLDSDRNPAAACNELLVDAGQETPADMLGVVQIALVAPEVCFFESNPR